ncbi:MAG: hypothetical protein M1826_002046 [Phylliscum demangeonii]|nr:MAG: hypothetical protein M1826_002046 [Phylliscum demangeonii]
MASTGLQMEGRDQRIRSVLAFTESLSSRLRAENTDAALIADLQHQINGFPLSNSAFGVAKAAELDARGTALWNLSTRMKRNERQASDKTVLCLVRIFAFLVMDYAQQTAVQTPPGCVRLLKVALKTARVALDTEGLDWRFGTLVLEGAAHYEAELSKVVEQSEAARYEQLSAEYFIVRTVVAWRQSRLDLAEHLFREASLARKTLDPSTAENLADLLYEIGRDLLRQKRDAMAAKWLERAYDALCRQNVEGLSPEAGELRLSIMHDLVKSLLATRTEEALAKAGSLLNILDENYGEKLIVLLLRLELVTVLGQASEASEYLSILCRMMRIIRPSDVHFQLIMRLIHRLNSKSPAHACRALDELLQCGVYSAEQGEWLEKAFVTRLWISIAQVPTAETVDEVRSGIDKLAGHLRSPLSPAATHAVQIVRRAFAFEESTV